MFANYLELHHYILSDACHTLSLIEIPDDYLQFYLSVCFLLNFSFNGEDVSSVLGSVPEHF